MSEPNGNGGVVQKAVNSAMFTLVSRGAMILATGVGLPIALWVMSQLFDLGKSISRDVTDTVREVRELKIETQFKLQAIQTEIGGARSQLNDHEGRIRFIENRPSAPRSAQ